MIVGADIERGERILRMAYGITRGTNNPKVILDRARVDPEAFDSLIKHHKEILFRQYMPDVDPRVESSILTMFMHFFALGAISQRVADKRDDV